MRVGLWYFCALCPRRLPVPESVACRVPKNKRPLHKFTDPARLRRRRVQQEAVRGPRWHQILCSSLHEPTWRSFDRNDRPHRRSNPTLFTHARRCPYRRLHRCHVEDGQLSLPKLLFHSFRKCAVTAPAISAAFTTVDPCHAADGMSLARRSRSARKNRSPRARVSAFIGCAFAALSEAACRAA